MIRGRQRWLGFSDECMTSEEFLVYLNSLNSIKKKKAVGMTPPWNISFSPTISCMGIERNQHHRTGQLKYAGQLQ